MGDTIRVIVDHSGSIVIDHGYGLVHMTGSLEDLPDEDVIHLIYKLIDDE